jgi:hypothetical protein
VDVPVEEILRPEMPATESAVQAADQTTETSTYSAWPPQQEAAFSPLLSARHLYDSIRKHAHILDPNRLLGSLGLLPKPRNVTRYDMADGPHDHVGPEMCATAAPVYRLPLESVKVTSTENFWWVVEGADKYGYLLAAPDVGVKVGPVSEYLAADLRNTVVMFARFFTKVCPTMVVASCHWQPHVGAHVKRPASWPLMRTAVAPHEVLISL